MLAECLRFGESTFNLEILSDLVLFTRDTNCIPLALCMHGMKKGQEVIHKGQGYLTRVARCFTRVSTKVRMLHKGQVLPHQGCLEG